MTCLVQCINMMKQRITDPKGLPLSMTQLMHPTCVDLAFMFLKLKWNEHSSLTTCTIIPAWNYIFSLLKNSSTTKSGQSIFFKLIKNFKQCLSITVALTSFLWGCETFDKNLTFGLFHFLAQFLPHMEFCLDNCDVHNWGSHNRQGKHMDIQ